MPHSVRSKEDQDKERGKTIHGSPIGTREAFADVTASIKGVSGLKQTEIDDTVRTKQIFYPTNQGAVVVCPDVRRQQLSQVRCWQNRR